MTRRTAREMAQDRLATAKRKREAVEARIVRAGAELRAAELALREAEAAEEYAAAHPLLRAVETAEVCEHGMDAASCLACEGGEG